MCSDGSIIHLPGSDEPAISLGQIGELVDGFRRQIDLIGEARRYPMKSCWGR